MYAPAAAVNSAIMTGMDAKASRRCWFYPRPAWLVYGAVVATGVLFASERWRWFAFNEHKGWTVLLAVAVVAVVLVLIVAWMFAALLFRRRAQFGLATLLVFVTLCALVCSWLAVRIKQARRQAEAVAAIRKMDYGTAVYLGNAVPPEPEPLRKLMGDDFFSEVVNVRWGFYSEVPGIPHAVSPVPNYAPVELLRDLPDIRTLT